MTHRMMTTAETSVYIGGEAAPVTPQTLEIWRLQKKGPPFHKIGKFVRYSQVDVDVWLASCRHTSTAAYPTHLNPHRTAA